MNCTEALKNGMNTFSQLNGVKKELSKISAKYFNLNEILTSNGGRW